MSNELFTTKATAKGGRDGHVKSEDGVIDLILSCLQKIRMKQVRTLNNFSAAAYSSCYDGALNLVAKQKNKKIDTVTTAEVSFLKEGESGFKIAVKLVSEFNGVAQDEAEELMKEAHQVCPYSKATRGNVDVELEAKSNES